MRIQHALALIPLAACAGQSYTYGGEPFSYWEVANEQAFRHWRYLITDNEGGQTYADEVGIVEIEMFEAEPVD